LSGTTVTINDTGPASDRYNLTIVEVRAAPASGGTSTISGAITPALSGSGATLTLSGASAATVIADATGNYTFTGLANGSYTVTPTKAGFSFTPVNRPVTVNGANVAAINFTAAAVTYSIAGTVGPVGGGAIVTLSLNGSAIAAATAGANGSYSFANVANGTYTVTPTKTGVSFTPVNRAVTVNGANVTAINFTATAVTYSIAGTISPAANGSGATVTLSGGATATVTAGTTGNYTFTGLANGSYTVTPTKAGFTFVPVNRAVTVNGGNVTAINFNANPTSQSLNYPDFSVIMPPGRMAVVGSGPSREFQYTHDTFNGGSGPLVIQPEYNAASGAYLGTQYIYSFNAGTWTLAQQIPIAGAFIFHGAHGHFHFPLVTFGLYAVAANGGLGAPVALSEKNGFCINDSFIYDPTLPNAGAHVNFGSCSDPTSLRGLNVGAVDEYDKTDPGQSISLVGITDGDYWLRAVVDPENFLFESDKSNNETDVLITINGNTVTEHQRVTPVLPPPPIITLTSPADQTQASGTITLAASTATGTAVQYLLDGVTLGGPVAAPYTLAWDTTAVPDGSHWLAVQTKDPTSGRIGTSRVAKVIVTNGGTHPPVVTVSSPEPGATVFAVTIIGATVATAVPITSVQFYVDGVPVGPPLTAPPYLMHWDTRLFLDGQHLITAAATDSFNLTGTSDPVTVTVDNSHPPNTIGIDATVFRDASDTMTTPALSTTTSSDLLVAFVAYDGPTNVRQTATVSGAGLVWTLVTRSNFQLGTSEIWVAKANGVLSNVTVTSQPGVAGYHGSLVVIAFINAAGPGIVGQASAQSGAPDIFLPGVSAGNWVFAVGNDWDSATGRIPVSGQVLVHQRIDSAVGDTFWVQSTAAPSTATALVNIHDNSPTTDQWNYAAVEIVATRQ
jgi:hypothetical protein